MNITTHQLTLRPVPTVARAIAASGSAGGGEAYSVLATRDGRTFEIPVYVNHTDGPRVRATSIPAALDPTRPSGDAGPRTIGAKRGKTAETSQFDN